ncbi:hypothetical protein KFE25_003226 [Diacronema lutheri]|uniref:RAB6-interacting golgin n=2 Tax=Diacronema lutheri TaxID=2081491 RepID=A0A8J5XCM7_DIALT|nr:hypothetical protein KFE25_003226 [Diacronema lutheri]
MAPDPDESEAKVKQKELTQRIREREEVVKRQQERLEQLNAQLEQLEGPQRHTIEQLRIEIDRVDKLLNGARADQVSATLKVAEATELLERKTEDKRSSSDQLYTMLLDSEEGKSAKLAELEARFDRLLTSLVAPAPDAALEARLGTD